MGYWPYWALRFTEPDYYSFEIGPWTFISLNSESENGEGSKQLDWLKGQLATRTDNCVIAYYHQPRYNAGQHGDQPAMEPVWRELRGRVALVLNGHDHNYQRIEVGGWPRELIVGTGGRGFYEIDQLYPGLEAFQNQQYGALKLELEPGRARHEFHTVGGTVFDRGEVGCRAFSPPTDTGRDGGDREQEEDVEEIGDDEEEPEDGDDNLLIVKAKRRQNIYMVLRRGLTVRVRCTRRCTLKSTVMLRYSGRKRKRTIAHRVLNLESDGTKDQWIRIPRRYRQLLKGKERAKLIVIMIARDEDGETARSRAVVNLIRK